MGESDKHLFELAGKIGAQTEQIRSLTDQVNRLTTSMDELKTTTSSLKETNNQIRMGGRFAVLLIGLFGGAAGGKIAHMIGLLQDTAATSH